MSCLYRVAQCHLCHERVRGSSNKSDQLAVGASHLAHQLTGSRQTSVCGHNIVRASHSEGIAKAHACFIKPLMLFHLIKPTGHILLCPRPSPTSLRAMSDIQLARTKPSRPF